MPNLPLLAILLLLAAPVHAVQGSDDCTSAPVSPPGVVFTFDTAQATASGMTGGISGPDLFWRFTVPGSGRWRLTVASPDPDARGELSACAGSSSALAPDNTFEFEASALTGISEFWVRAGTTTGAPTSGTVILQQVCGWSPFFGGGFLLTPDALEDNDTCAQAIQISPGTYPGLTCASNDPDFYRVTVPAQMELLFDVDEVAGDGVFSSILDGATCSQSPGAFRRYRNLTGAPVDVVLRVESNACAEYDMDVVVRDDFCQIAGPDAFEPNDSSAAAALVTAGTLVDLNVDSQEPDYFAVDVLPGQWVTFRATARSGNGPGFNVQTSTLDENLELVETTRCDAGPVFVNRAAGQSRVYFLVRSNVCTIYDLDVIVGGSQACGFAIDDALEPNGSSCCIGDPSAFTGLPPGAISPGAVTLTDGVYPGLTVGPSYSFETDAYSIRVEGGGTLTATARYDGAFGVVGLASLVRNEVGTCLQLSGASVAMGGGVTTFIYTNSSSSSRFIRLSVFLTADSLSPCNGYELQIEGSETSTLGWTETSYCGPAASNSSGFPAILRTSGSGGTSTTSPGRSAVLYAENMPTGVFGFFLSSPTQGNLPMLAGTQGTLCLGGAIGRHLDFIFETSGAGTAALRQSFDEMPTPGGLVPVPAGTNWNFQAWFRDSNPSGTANLTNGLTIQF